MPCSVCVTSAPRCFLTGSELAKTATLRVRNVRYLTIEKSRHFCHTSSFALKHQPARAARISTLQPSPVQKFLVALSPTENLRRREELPYRDRIDSMTGSKDPARTRESSEGAAQTTTMPKALHSVRDSIEFGGFLKPQASPKSDASFDQSWPKEELEGPRQRRDAIFDWPRDSTRGTNIGSSKLAARSRKARLRDYCSGSKGTVRSSRSTTVSAEARTGIQNYKDQREPWQTQKSALSEKFGPTGWCPRKRLSPDTLDGIRTLHGQYPDKFTTSILADQFKISPEAIRRILKSKWRPKDEEEERRRRRWEKRGENIWTQMVEVGIKPPKKWRDMGVGKEREKERESRLGANTSSLKSSPQ